jgi:hypothetical protein
VQLVPADVDAVNVPDGFEGGVGEGIGVGVGDVPGDGEGADATVTVIFCGLHVTVEPSLVF